MFEAFAICGILYEIQDMNWPALISTGIILTALVVFLIRRNMKDEKEFEQQAKNNYNKAKDEEDDVDLDNILK